MAKHIFYKKISSVHLHEGPKLRMHYWNVREEKKKAQHLAGSEPTTRKVLLRRRVLYRCATTTALEHLATAVNLPNMNPTWSLDFSFLFTFLGKKYF